MKQRIIPCMAVMAGLILGSCASAIKPGPERLIIGTWRIASVNCDVEGRNCPECTTGYPCGLVIRFMNDGTIVATGDRRGTYRVEGNRFFITLGYSVMTINILYIDEKTMKTGEEGMSATELWVRTGR